MRRLRACTALAIAMGVLGAQELGCSSTDEEKKRLAELAEGCSLNSDCEAPLICAFELCHTQCLESRDCPSGERCVHTDDPSVNVCQLPEESDCQSSKDCKGKQICTPDGQCRDVCTGHGDCVIGQVCTNQNGCAEPDEVDANGNLIGVDGGAGSGGSSGAGGGGTGGNGANGGSGGASGNAGTGGAGGSGGGTGGAGGAGGVGGAGGAGGTGGTGGSAGQAGMSGGGAGNDGGAGDASMGGSGGGCASGWADCDSDPSDCETPLNLLTSCGSCNTVCDSSFGNVKCNPQTLTCEVSSCNTGRGDCDGNANTGCETDLQTSTSHCGFCTHACLGSTCSNGFCTPVQIGDSAGGVAFTVTDDAIWEMQCNASPCSIYTVRRHPKAGPTSTILDQASFPAGGIVADGNDVIIAAQGNPSAFFKLTASGTKTLLFSTVKKPLRLGLWGNKIVFSTTAGEIVHVEKDGTQETVIASGQPSIRQFAVSPTNAYWVSLNSSTYSLHTVPLAGGSVADVEVVASNTELVAHGAYVYWDVRANSPLDRIARHSPGAGTEVVVQGQAFHTFGTDGTFIYYVLYTGGNGVSLYKRPLAGGLTTNLGIVFAAGTIWSVDSQFVYYEGNFSRAMKVAK